MKNPSQTSSRLLLIRIDKWLMFFEEDILASEVQFVEVSEHSVHLSAVKWDTAGEGTGENDECFFLETSTLMLTLVHKRDGELGGGGVHT